MAATATSPSPTAKVASRSSLPSVGRMVGESWIAAKPQKGSPIVDEALLRIAALYKVEDAIRGSDPDRRRAGRQKLSLPLVDEFFAWLTAQAKRVSRKSDLGEAMAYMLKRQIGFRGPGLARRHWRHGPLPSSMMAASIWTRTWSKMPSAARP